MSGFAIAVVLYLLFVVLLVAIVPGLIGERAGHRAAQEMRQRITASTQANSPDELWKRDELLMRGHVIAVSEKKIAFYDARAKQVRIFDADEMELRTRPNNPNRPTRKAE